MKGKIATKMSSLRSIRPLSSLLTCRQTYVDGQRAFTRLTKLETVVIKDSWVDVNRPKEGDTLRELLDDASDDEKATFLTVLLHGVVVIEGREDLASL